MQEVTIKPRQVFQYPVCVDVGGKQITWNFTTRRKNVSFGLFKRRVDTTSTYSAPEPLIPSGATPSATAITHSSKTFNGSSDFSRASSTRLSKDGPEFQVPIIPPVLSPDITNGTKQETATSLPSSIPSIPTISSCVSTGVSF